LEVFEGREDLKGFQVSAVCVAEWTVFHLLAGLRCLEINVLRRKKKYA
jgi:hypothetical protein